MPVQPPGFGGGGWGSVPPPAEGPEGSSASSFRATTPPTNYAETFQQWLDAHPDASDEVKQMMHAGIEAANSFPDPVTEHNIADYQSKMQTISTALQQLNEIDMDSARGRKDL